MSEQGTNLNYAVMGELVWIRVTGRANCILATEFKALIEQFRGAGRCRFSLDLRDCALMDSSFLGMLGGLEQELGTGKLESGEYALELVQANERVAELIRSLGLDEYFKLLSAHREFPEQWIPVPPSGGQISNADCSKMSLKAHEVIVQLNPANEAKFRDVLKFLKEDVKRIEENEGQ